MSLRSAPPSRPEPRVTVTVAPWTPATARLLKAALDREIDRKREAKKP